MSFSCDVGFKGDEDISYIDGMPHPGKKDLHKFDNEDEDIFADDIDTDRAFISKKKISTNLLKKASLRKENVKINKH